VNLKELSAHLGLSPTTVSRALNGYSDVAESTRERVVEAAERLGYQPNMAARRLAIGRADAVGLIYPPDVGDLADPRFLEVVAGMTERFSASNIDLLIVATQRADELATYERLVQNRRIDALIVARTRLEDPRIDYLVQAKFPFVAYGRTARPQGYAWFDFDNEAGTALAVQRLIGFGHRRIAYVHAPPVLNFAGQRLAGYQRAMVAAGLAVDPACVVQSDLGRRGGLAAAQQLLALPARPTAIIVDNNLAGVGVVRALIDSGLLLGRDMSVIVYDGVPVDNLLRGTLVTSIDQPTPRKAGTQMAGMVLDLLGGKPIDQLQVLWQPVITPGTSDGPVGG
jgi:LacI family transcriptional regulator